MCGIPERFGGASSQRRARVRCTSCGPASEKAAHRLPFFCIVADLGGCARLVSLVSLEGHVRSYPFNPEKVMPRMKYFWPKAKMITMGMIINTENAI